MYCVKCGAQSLGADRFCRTCGAALPTPTAATPAPVPQPQAMRTPVAAASTSAVATTSAPLPRYAGFWRRLLAALIDLVIIWPVWLVLSGLYEFAAARMLERTVFAPDGVELSRMLALSSAGRALLPITLVFVYFALMEGTPVGGSLGKLLIRLRVTKTDGGRTGLVRATLRTAMKPLSALPLMFGYLMAGFTGRKQALHDLMSGSLVVRR